MITSSKLAVVVGGVILYTLGLYGIVYEPLPMNRPGDLLLIGWTLVALLGAVLFCRGILNSWREAPSERPNPPASQTGVPSAGSKCKRQ